MLTKESVMMILTIIRKWHWPHQVCGLVRDPSSRSVSRLSPSCRVAHTWLPAFLGARRHTHTQADDVVVVV